MALLALLAPSGFAADPPASRPVTPQEAVYRSNLALANLLLDNPSDEELRQFGSYCRARGDFSRAAVVYLMALRGKPNDPRLEFELASVFAAWDQVDLGMEYLKKAAEHGYWGYRVIAEDTDVDPLKKHAAFPAALAKIKASFDREAPKVELGMTVCAPVGEAPSAGWPVVVFLHGWGARRQDFDDEAKFVSTLGYVGVTIDANEPMGPGAFTWGREAVERTHKRISELPKQFKVRVDPKRVYVQGFSQGAMYAVRLLADYPASYAGAICNSPGSPWLIPKKLANPQQTGGVYITFGDQDSGVGTWAASIEKLWNDSRRPVQVLRFSGGHQLPPDDESMFKTALEYLSKTK